MQYNATKTLCPDYTQQGSVHTGQPTASKAASIHGLRFKSCPLFRSSSGTVITVYGAIPNPAYGIRDESIRMFFPCATTNSARQTTSIRSPPLKTSIHLIRVLQCHNHQQSTAHLCYWKRMQHLHRLSTSQNKHISNDPVFISLRLSAHLAQQ